MPPEMLLAISEIGFLFLCIVVIVILRALGLGK